MGPDSVLIIHMGGAYGDKPSSIKRFEEAFLKLPERVRTRLVLENDEVCYSVEDLLPVCTHLRIPLVLDWHHDYCNPSSRPVQEYLPDIEEIWRDRGIRIKQHYSESAPGHPNKRAHSDYVKKLPPCAPNMDLMIEAKMKEQTVLKLCQIYGIEPDTDTYPLTQPRISKGDEKLFRQVDMNGNGKGRKKHDWAGGAKETEEDDDCCGTNVECEIHDGEEDVPSKKRKGKERVAQVQDGEDEAIAEETAKKRKGKGSATKEVAKPVPERTLEKRGGESSRSRFAKKSRE